MKVTVKGSAPSVDQVITYAAALLLLFLTLALVVGLAKQAFFVDQWISGRTYATYTVAAVVLAMTHVALATWFIRASRCLLLCEVVFLLALWGLPAALFVAATLAAYALIGRFLMRRVRLKAAYSTNPYLALAAGLIAFGWVMQAAAFLPIHNATSYGVCLILIIFAGRRSLLSWFGSAHRGLRSWSDSEDVGLRIAVGMAQATIVFFAFVTRIPEMGTDALMTHLAITTQIVRDGRLIPDPSLLTWAYIPKSMHFAYLPVHILSGEYGLRLMHVVFGILPAAAVASEVARSGALKSSWLVVAFLVGSPLLLQESASIFVDSYLSFVSVAATLALIQLWRDGFPLRESMLVAALFGGVGAAKLHGLAFAPFAGAIFIFGAAEGRLREHRWVILGGAVFVYFIIASPSYVIAWIATGNPLLPFFNQIFRSPFYSTDGFRFPFAQPPIGLAMWRDMAVDGAKYLEGTGPLSMFHIFCFAPLVVLGLTFCRNPSFLIPAVIGLGHIALVIGVQNYLRYHTAGFFILSIAIGLVISHLWKEKVARPVVVMAATTILFANALYAVKGSYLYLGINVWQLATAEGQARIESWRAPERAIVRATDALLGPNERAAIFWHSFVGLSRSDMLPMHPFFGYSAWQAFDRALSAGTPASFFNKYGVTHVILRHGQQFQGSNALFEWLSKHARTVSSNDGAAVYAISAESLFDRVIIPFESPIAGWDRSGTPTQTAGGGLRVSGANLAVRTFDAHDGQQFQLRLRASCTRGEIAWLHINWYDLRGAYMRPDIINRVCGPGMNDHDAVFVAPVGARRGAVILDTLPGVEIEIAGVGLVTKATASR
jgi:hypothetical protein